MDKTRRRLAWASLAGTSAILLAVAISLGLARVQVQAQPALDVTAAVLNVQKDVSRGMAAPGDTLAYTITVQNTGDVETTTWITDVLPADLTYVGGSLGQNHGTPSMVDGVLTWNETIWGGQTVQIWYSTNISSETTSGQVQNTAQVTGTGTLITDPAVTTLLSGQAPGAQVQLPESGAIVTDKGTLEISGVAWDASIPRPFPGAAELLPIDNYGGGGTYNIEWTAAISAVNYVLQESTNPQFSNPETFSTVDTLYFIAGRDIGTYYYRVQAYNADVRPSRWSNVESVAVVQTTQVNDASSVVALAEPLAPAQVAASGPVTVMVRIDDGGWNVAETTLDAGGWWNWSYDWTMPEEDDVQHTINVQAQDGVGSLSPVDTINVTLRNQNYVMYLPLFNKRWPPVPLAPTLQDISNADEDAYYTVQWSYDYTYPTVSTYSLQESTDASFTNPTEYNVGSSTSYAFTDKDDGTYYYRVRGHNSWGAGDWSTIKSVTVRTRTFYYEFNGSGRNTWPIRRTSAYEGEEWATWTEEHDGTIYILMDDKFDFSIASPFEEAPDPPYDIEVKARIHDPANLTAYGIIFGGNGGSPCPAYREDGCLSHYYRLEAIWDSRLKAGFKRIDEHEDDKGKGRGKELIHYQYVTGTGSGDDWHTWVFKVRTDGIAIYFDGAKIGSTDDTTYIYEPYFGIYASANEYKPAIGRFDYFYVEPK